MQDDRLSHFIEIAIKREEDAYAFYMDLYEKVEEEAARETLKWIADEEMKHRRFLVDYRDGNLQVKAMRMSDVTYYKIAEYQEEPEVTKDMDRSEIFLLAAHRELKAHQFYSELADLHPDGETQNMLRKMANEELKHKEKMEYLYTNTTFRQTSGG